MRFALTILGSSSAIPTSERFPTAHLLNVNERFFLIDCGEGTQIQLRRNKIGFGKLSQIFISHNHGDHTFGLYGLISSFQLLGRKAALHIYGPENLRPLLDFYRDNYMDGGDFEVLFYPVGHKRFQLIYEDRNIEVYSIPLKHRTPATGFLFREKKAQLNIKKQVVEKYKPGIEDIVKIKRGEDYLTENGKLIPNRELTLPAWKPRSYAFLSDTAYHRKVIDHIQEVDLLYHEATFEQKDKELAGKTYHSTSVDAAEIAREANAKRLLLGHFSTRYKQTDTLLEEARNVFPESYIVHDGDVFTVEREREGNKRQ